MIFFMNLRHIGGYCMSVNISCVRTFSSSRSQWICVCGARGRCWPFLYQCPVNTISMESIEMQCNAVHWETQSPVKYKWKLTKYQKWTLNSYAQCGESVRCVWRNFISFIWFARQSINYMLADDHIWLCE